MDLLAYMARKIGIAPQELVGAMPFEIVAVTRAGRAMGAVLYINFRGQSIEMSSAGNPGWLTRANLREIFAYPFEQLKCLRVWGVARADNTKACRLNEKLGFKRLAELEDEFGEGEHGVLYSMSRRNCRWISKG